MGSLIQNWKTIPLPEKAKVGRDGTVTWVARGKKKTGKLSGTGKVTVHVDAWTAQFMDETGKTQRVSTKTKNRSVAEKILARYEAEVDRIRTGVVTRDELAKVKALHITLDDALERFRAKMVASGCTPDHITLTLRRVTQFCRETDIDLLAKFRRETVERWMANEIQRKKRSARTINHYLTVVKSFVQYLVDTELLPGNLLKSIRKLNPELDRRKVRRAMTEDEVERLLQAAESGKYRKKNKTKEQVLTYRLLLGTGLRSTELSLLMPKQIDYEHNRLTIEAAKTKNKKADTLPIRSELVQSVKEWVESHGIQTHERIFRFNKNSIRRSFYRDLRVAGINRLDDDGRSIDIHSLRKTFGTLLAKAGVPLTTVQRLMRHSTPLLTAKLYIDVETIDLTQALEKLRVF